ncbi:hypothetical protein FJMB80151_16330 [Enterobacter hormaechei]|nr:hypothetical protein FJMB80063_16590 [Enterobacter hormaechei]BDK30094.1 hypothetical protein FJMB80068_16580 [Enterobacter hormaechei]BDK35122.1 hypothetical protein FJMB80144_16330 [Enterobacter hormaechei]BDK40320.1 hypothetical protein FJMB80145_16330 [Enterobacter hormaechei]BDK45526.1 hypothetical protein FJMB80146_16350 [Enterobacter hormaechei]
MFYAHKANFIASGQLSYHHYKTLRSTVAYSDLLPERTIANEIKSKDIRTIPNEALLKWKIKLIETANNLYIQRINYLRLFIY